MLAALLILLFPLLVGAVFGLLYVVQTQSSVVGRIGATVNLMVYAATLVLPLGAVGWSVATGELTLADLGVRWPKIPGLGISVSAVLSVGMGGGVGGAAYWGEKNVQTTVQGASPIDSDRTDVQYLMDGESGPSGAEEDHQGDGSNGTETTGPESEQQSVRTSSTEDGRARQEQAVLLLGTTGFAALAEETLWRGYLLAYAQLNPIVPIGWGLLLSAIAFGTNHAYFGWREVVSKSLLGAAWGLLFLGSGSLLAPAVSHLVFNGLALDVQIEH